MDDCHDCLKLIINTDTLHLVKCKKNVKYSFTVFHIVANVILLDY